MDDAQASVHLQQHLAGGIQRSAQRIERKLGGALAIEAVSRGEYALEALLPIEHRRAIQAQPGACR